MYLNSMLWRTQEQSKNPVPKWYFVFLQNKFANLKLSQFSYSPIVGGLFAKIFGKTLPFLKNKADIIFVDK